MLRQDADQLRKLRDLIGCLRDSNAFYGPRLKSAGLDENLDRLERFSAELPVTTKTQLVEDQEANPPFGTNLTFPPDAYTRFHQTSGTTGRPLRWLDTEESWRAMLDCWQTVLRAAGVGAGDRALFAFSFGPFLGFWTAFEAATASSVLCLPGGGMTSLQRLHLLVDNEMTVLFCTPTYALRLADVARENQIDLGQSSVRRIIVAGEAGGSVPETRVRIERAWPGAAVFDHHGMTEVGPVTFENPTTPGFLHVIDEAYLTEVVDPETLEPVPDGQVGELLLTTLRRTGMPLLRYRTGDLVRRSTCSAEQLGRGETALEGGILGRCDDMLVIRGNNVYPSAIDAIIWQAQGVAEYRVDIHKQADAMPKLAVSVERDASVDDVRALADRVARRIESFLPMRVPVEVVEPGTLPRFEMKAQRWKIHDHDRTE